MNPDLTTAYSFARPLLNSNDPGSSIFATYVSNGHCNDPVCEDPANVPIMQDLLSQWATVEVSQTSGAQVPTAGSTLANPPYVTLTMAIPTPLPLITSAGACGDSL